MTKCKHHTQEIAAAKAGISIRTARRIESDVTLPSQKPRRYWRSRPDPFADVWDAVVVPLLRQAPQLMGVTLLRKLQEDHPDRFPDGMLRTLQRRVSHWRALEGPAKEVFFPQEHVPGNGDCPTLPTWATCGSPLPACPSIICCTTSCWRSVSVRGLHLSLLRRLCTLTCRACLVINIKAWLQT